MPRIMLAFDLETAPPDSQLYWEDVPQYPIAWVSRKKGRERGCDPLMLPPGGFAYHNAKGRCYASKVKKPMRHVGETSATSPSLFEL